MSTWKKNDAQVVPLLPLHDVVDGGVSRSKGRPKKVEHRPTRADLDHHAQVASQQAEHVEADKIVCAVVERRDVREVLFEVSEALAKEAAVLEYQRRQLELRGRDVGQLVSRRANILVELTRLQVRLRDLDSQVLDLRSEPMQRIYKEWIRTIAGVAEEVLPPQQFDVFFNKLENRLQGWEDEIEARLR